MPVSRDDKISAMHDRAVECLETFREGFLPSFRDGYRLTLIARDEAHPDGSHDIIVTSDTEAGIRAATELRFPRKEPADE